IQRQIEQQPGIPRGIPYFQAAKYLERPHMGVTFVRRAYGLNGHNQLAVVITFGQAYTFRDRGENDGGEMLATQPLPPPAAPTRPFLHQCRRTHTRLPYQLPEAPPPPLPPPPPPPKPPPPPPPKPPPNPPRDPP